MIARLAGIDPRILGGLAFGVAFLAALELVRPFTAGPVAFDSAASVIHFDRIVSGRQLEAFVTTTPKPFLTVVYGLLHALTGDWRAISLAAISAYAAAVALGGWFAWRLGGAPAGLFCVVGLIGSESLLTDVDIALAVPWALLGWFVAGLAMTGSVARPGLAGAALALASLARVETLVLVAVCVAAVAVATVAARRRGRPVPRRLWLLGIGFLAVPGMLLHDWLLTGDPFFWVSVSTRYSLATPGSVMSPLELARFAVVRYAGMAMLTTLGMLGAVVLAGRRAWVPLAGLLALGPGVGAFLMLLAFRDTYVSPRYFAAIDLAVVVAAAVGAAALAEAVSRLRRGVPAPPAVIAVALAVALAVVASWPIPSLDPHFRSSARAQLALAEHSDRAVVTLRPCVTDVGAAEIARAGGVVLLVPVPTRPRFVVDLGLGLDVVGSTPARVLTAGEDFLPQGRYLVHDPIGDRSPEAFAILEVDAPTTIGGVTLSPILADPDAGLWVLRVDRAGSESDGTC